MSRPLPTSEQRIRTYNERGWAPVRWSHLPPEVKALYRRIRRVPKMKACWYNAQILAFLADQVPGLEYYEGWVHRIIPMDHAWLRFHGQIVDPTLGGEQSAGSLASSYPEGMNYAVPWNEVRASMGRTGFYGPIRPQQLQEVGPFAEIMRESSSSGNRSSR